MLAVILNLIIGLIVSIIISFPLNFLNIPLLSFIVTNLFLLIVFSTIIKLIMNAEWINAFIASIILIIFGLIFLLIFGLIFSVISFLFLGVFIFSVMP